MKSILKLIGLEMNFMKGTVAAIGIILTIFTGALLAVIGVIFDVPSGMYKNINETFTNMTITVHDASLGEGRALGGDFAYGTQEGLTSGTTLVSESGAFYTIPKAGDNLINVNVRGYAMIAEDAKYLSNFGGGKAETLMDGEWFSEPWQICVTGTVSGALGAKIGQTIQIGEHAFVLTGIYTITAMREAREPKYATPPTAYFYVTLPKDYVLEQCMLDFSDSLAMLNRYHELAKSGRDVSLTEVMAAKFANIDFARAFFGAVAILLGVVDGFILYALIALFYRQRKTQICRLKMLGAKNGVIAGIYCVIAVMLVAVSVLLGTALSVAFNAYYADLCTRLFQTSFVPKFRVGVPFTVFGVQVLFVFLLFVGFRKKISNTRIAEEVRSE